MQVQIGDYGFTTLKKYCKMFHNYDQLSNWSAPEIWETQYVPDKSNQSRNLSLQRLDRSKNYFNQPSVDIYSYGVLLWELETGSIPFQQETRQQVYNLLTKEKMRPRIPPETNKSLALLIRRCWQDQPDKRPGLHKIIDTLKICEFSSNFL